MTWRPDDAGVGDYPDFMSKEMAEQPGIIARLADDHAALAQDLADRIRTLVRHLPARLRHGVVRRALRHVPLLPDRAAAHQLRARLGVQVSRALHHAALARHRALAERRDGGHHRGRQRGAGARGADRRARQCRPVRASRGWPMSSCRSTAGPEQCVLSTKAYTREGRHPPAHGVRASRANWRRGRRLLTRARQSASSRRSVASARRPCARSRRGSSARSIST